MTARPAPRWHRLLREDPKGARLLLLDLMLHRLVPFNRPHGIRLAEVSEDRVSVVLPWRRANLNHLGGMHACAMATAAEYSSGLLLLRKIDPSELRLIMRSIAVDYSKQGRGASVASSELSGERFEKEVLAPISESGLADVVLESKVVDRSGNELCTARVAWQLKRWDRVRARG